MKLIKLPCLPIILTLWVLLINVSGSYAQNNDTYYSLIESSKKQYNNYLNNSFSHFSNNENNINKPEIKLEKSFMDITNPITRTSNIPQFQNQILQNNFELSDIFNSNSLLFSNNAQLSNLTQRSIQSVYSNRNLNRIANNSLYTLSNRNSLRSLNYRTLNSSSLSLYNASWWNMYSRSWKINYYFNQKAIFDRTYAFRFNNNISALANSWKLAYSRDEVDFRMNLYEIQRKNVINTYDLIMSQFNNHVYKTDLFGVASGLALSLTEAKNFKGSFGSYSTTPSSMFDIVEIKDMFLNYAREEMIKRTNNYNIRIQQNYQGWLH